MNPHQPPFLVKSNRVELRKQDLSLAEPMFQLVEHERVRLKRFDWLHHTKTVDDEIKHICWCQEQWDTCEVFEYGMIENESQAFMGCLGVHTISWDNNSCVLGYWIGGSFEGKGYVSEAIAALETMLFDSGFNRIVISCQPNNPRSANVAIRRGFTFEGILRQSAIIRGSYCDMAVYSKLRSDVSNEESKI